MASRFNKIISADRFFWFPGNDEKKKYNPITGFLLARTERFDGQGYQYLVELTAECWVKAPDKSIKKVSAGTNVLVDERHQLSALEPILRERTLFEIEITPRGTVPTKNVDKDGKQKRVWVFDVGVADTGKARAPVGAARAAAPAASRDPEPEPPFDGSDDDIPF